MVKIVKKVHYATDLPMVDLRIQNKYLVAIDTLHFEPKETNYFYVYLFF